MRISLQPPCLIFPYRLQIEILPSLGTAHAPTLSLVPRANPQRPPPRRDVDRAAGFTIAARVASLGRLSSSLELGNPFRLESRFFRIRRVGYGLEAGYAGTS